MQQIIDFLTVNGNGTGASTLKVDGSSTPVAKGYFVPTGFDHLKVEQIQLYFEDDATTDADGTFMNLNQGPAAALANGLEVGIYEPAVAGTIDGDADTQVLNLLAVGLASAKKTGDFPSCGWTYEEISFSAGDSVVLARRVFRQPLIVKKGLYIGVNVQDDLTAFTDAEASILAVAK